MRVSNEHIRQPINVVPAGAAAATVVLLAAAALLFEPVEVAGELLGVLTIKRGRQERIPRGIVVDPASGTGTGTGAGAGDHFRHRDRRDVGGAPIIVQPKGAKKELSVLVFVAFLHHQWEVEKVDDMDVLEEVQENGLGFSDGACNAVKMGEDEGLEKGFELHGA